jgi:hypothetical protein
MKTELKNSNFGYSKLLVLIIELFLVIYTLGLVFTLINSIVGWLIPYTPDSVEVAMKLISFAILVYIMLQIRKLLKDAINNNVFDISIYNKLKKIGFVFIGLDFIKGVFALWAVIANPVYQKNFTVFYQSISWMNFFTGLVFLSISEIIRLGVKIKEENDLTV